MLVCFGLPNAEPRSKFASTPLINPDNASGFAHSVTHPFLRMMLELHQVLELTTCVLAATPQMVIFLSMSSAVFLKNVSVLMCFVMILTTSIRQSGLPQQKGLASAACDRSTQVPSRRTCTDASLCSTSAYLHCSSTGKDSASRKRPGLFQVNHVDTQLVLQFGRIPSCFVGVFSCCSTFVSCSSVLLVSRISSFYATLLEGLFSVLLLKLLFASRT